MSAIVIEGLVIRLSLTLARQKEHLSGKSAIHEHNSSCKDCHSCSISNFYTISQANTDFEARIKEAKYI